MVSDVFKEALEILENKKFVENFALIGKLALVFQVPSIAATLDIDFLAIFKDEGGFEESLRERNFLVGRILLPEGAPMFRFWRRERPVPVDVFVAGRSWLQRVVREALEFNFLGHRVRAARKEDVLVMKVAFYREFKDRGDIETLLRFPDLDLERVKELAKEANVLQMLEKWIKREKNPT